jgi:hypothetical protein
MSFHSGRMNEVSSTIIPEDQSVEKVGYSVKIRYLFKPCIEVIFRLCYNLSLQAECNLLKCLHEMDRCAQQLKARSERILNILAVQLKPSS